MKYLVYYKEEMIEFTSKGEYEVFLSDKPNVRHKSCRTKKEEKEFRELCKRSPVYEKKIYVGIDEGVPIRFETWNECQTYLKLHPNMIVKSFTNNEAAQHFNNVNVHRNSLSDVLIGYIPYKSLNGKSTDIAYFLLENNKVLGKEELGTLVKLPYWERELKIVVRIIEKAIEMKEERVAVIYNNQGVELWANGSWKTSKPQTVSYKEKIDELSLKINITFVKYDNLKNIDENIKKIVDTF